MELLTIYTDGGARGNPGPAGIGVVIKNGQAIVGRHKAYIGEATNNIAEYKALILGLKQSLELKASEVQVIMDSELVVRQMKGLYKIKEPSLKELAMQALQIIKNFKKVDFKHVPREQNAEADELVNQAIDEAVNE